ncbi:hypothetical protein G7Y89_g11926 [Cudoniella acicularis]|uniref:DUF676 domain-containing protein n=1 Tax=Cudoniella acicularis TaxID=354080 RepID=A0A8H4W061_9HELO|nr:hypothetical protein G7Y89_g11926 [Cudoniella acicularis]
MPLGSKTSIRVTEIPKHTKQEDYEAFAKNLRSQPPLKLGKSDRLRKLLRSHQRQTSRADSGEEGSSNDRRDGRISIQTEETRLVPSAELSEETGKTLFESFASLNGVYVGTLSFGSSELKDNALRKHKEYSSKWEGWVLKDTFAFLTVLYDYGDAAKVDICAVHGLGGNAMDTWTADGNMIWLRDILPTSDYFKESRIMTFGYDSDLTAGDSVMEVEDWARTLLTTVNNARSSQTERQRPIIFVCHSLGGLVGRKAMILLQASRFEGIQLDQCGLLFLSTPHSGTTVADWQDFLVALAGTFANVRQSTLKRLESFNPMSASDKEGFLALDPCPTYRCLAEGKMTKIKGISKYIVTSDSAALDPRHQARKIMGTDHNSICKFDSNISGEYMEVHSELKAILDVLRRQDQDVKVESCIPPGHPHFAAHAYPPDRGHWWQGNRISELSHRTKSNTQCFGREEELRRLNSHFAGAKTQPTLTVIKGIGGIGKTEVLSEFTVKQKGQRNIFFLHANNQKTFDETIERIAMDIGFDMIENPNLNRTIWRTTSPAGRIEIFYNWLSHSCNADSLLIVDDLDAFGNEDIKKVLACQAQHILISTRWSDLVWTTQNRDFLELRLPPMSSSSMVSIMKATTIYNRSRQLEDNDLESIAPILCGHPLAASLAVPFISQYLSTYDEPAQEFMNLLQSSDPEDRELFLKFNLGGLFVSVWDSFEQSHSRIQKDSGQAATLMGILSFLRIDDDCFDEFFKQKKPWINNIENELPDASIFKAKYITLAMLLGELRKVSFYLEFPQESKKRLNVHPLMLDFARLRAGEEGRLRFAKQIFRVCYESVTRSKKNETFILPHVQHCLRICRGFNIDLRTLQLPGHVLQWLEDPDFQDPFSDSENLLEDAREFHLKDESAYDEQIQEYITQCAQARKWFGTRGNTGFNEESRTRIVKLMVLHNQLEKYLAGFEGALPGFSKKSPSRDCLCVRGQGVEVGGRWSKSCPRSIYEYAMSSTGYRRGTCNKCRARQALIYASRKQQEQEQEQELTGAGSQLQEQARYLTCELCQKKNSKVVCRRQTNRENQYHLIPPTQDEL